MTIRFTNGQPDLGVTDEREAEQVLRQLYLDARFGDWEESGYSPARKLVWRNEREWDADGDAWTGGASRAVAEIVRD
jgi:hypothetical protein